MCVALPGQGIREGFVKDVSHVGKVWNISAHICFARAGELGRGSEGCCLKLLRNGFGNARLHYGQGVRKDVVP